MLLAYQAARRTQEVIRMRQTDELMRIEKGILQQINLGNFEYIYDGYISIETKEELERCGYKVATGSQYNQDWVRIKWH